ncbi:hypothetical protein M3661_27415 [Paenibacillus sp. MER 180]|uniref:hypothetical protein n=1 Tax=Paenibacillus sp. MER 180 TaxID=2939570 RepID=UPI0020405813|nr:hypothetical protein [Paenibacillus sp. MER 180]MCM3293828.1 hypothetical protein [Paenibacillus sp. MER 180]
MEETNLFEIETKWPRPDADLFKLGNDENRIILKSNPKLDEDFFEYAFDFKKAANILTTHILNHPRIDRLDTYFFPIVFLYRHSLELILKAIALKNITDLAEGRLFVKETFHNLSEILTKIEPFISENIEKNRDEFLWLQDLFEDMSSIDRDSDSFRYPFSLSLKRDGDPFDEGTKVFTIRLFFEEQTHINLIALASKMEVVFNILNAYYKNNHTGSENYKKYKPIFLEVGGTYYGQSVLGYSYKRKKFGPYVKGYTESAEFLVEYIKLNPKCKKSLFMPIGYLFRNGIELAMKEILFEECSFDFQEAARKVNRKKHKLRGIWNIIEGDILNHARPSEDDKTIDHVRRYVTQLHDFDTEADKFRYPTDKNLLGHFGKPLKLDFITVTDFFGELAYFLFGVVLMMSHQNELQADIEYEYSKMQWEHNDYNEY